MRNLGYLILLIFFLPLFLIFIGPLLVLAALRGRQPAGPITLNTLRYGAAGRIGALMLGLSIWILVWGGLAWVIITGVLPPSIVVDRPPAILSAAVVDIPTPQAGPQDEPSTTLPSPTLTPSNTATATLPESPSSPNSTYPVLVVTDTSTPMLGSTPSFTETSPTNVPASTTKPDSTPIADSSQLEIDETEALTITPRPAPPWTEQRSAIETVKEGNILLRRAISLASEENMKSLGTVWRGNALRRAQAFAAELNKKYAKPFDVRFEYVTLPTLNDESGINEIVVVSQETWNYGELTKVNQETFEFTYTLSQEDGHWVITEYSYRRLPTPVPTATSGSPQ